MKLNLGEKYRDTVGTVQAAAKDTSEGLKLLVLVGVLGLILGTLILVTDRQVLKAVRS